MEYTGYTSYAPNVPVMEQERQQGIGNDPHVSNSHIQDNIEQMLKYYARDQTVLSDKAYEYLQEIVRERSQRISQGTLSEASQGLETDDQLQAMHLQYDDITQANVKQTAFLKCSKSMVGRVIGKAGGTIKALQKCTGAMIQIDQSTDPANVIIVGSPQSLRLACSMISDISEGKFKGFAMLRQVATAKETTHQHGGDGMGMPVYVQGYGFLPPGRSMMPGYFMNRGNVPPCDVLESNALHSLPGPPSPQRKLRQFPTSQHHQSQPTVHAPNTSTHGYNDNNNEIDNILWKLAHRVQLGNQDDQIYRMVPDGFLSAYSRGSGRDHDILARGPNTLEDTPPPDIFLNPNSGVFARCSSKEQHEYKSSTVFDFM